MLWSEGSEAGPQVSGLQEPWPTASPAPAHGPTTPLAGRCRRQAAAKEKWVWGGGCGCECGCVVRAWGGLEPGGERQQNPHLRPWRSCYDLSP